MHVCTRCRAASGAAPAASGDVLACPADGASCLSHATAEECPRGLFRPATKPSSAREAAATAPTGERKPCCGQKILNGAVGLAKVAAQAVGIPLDQCPRDVEAGRLRICTGCDQNEGGKCRQCGCFVKLKVRVLSEKCPLPEPKW